MHDHEHQGGSNEENEHDHDHDHDLSDHKGESSYGWLWIVGIIVVVALALFFLQSNVPQDTDGVDGNDITMEDDSLRARAIGVYDVKAPKSVTPNALVGVDWVVSTEAEEAVIESTSIQWGTESFSEREFGTDVSPEGIYENETIDYLDTKDAIPAAFQTHMKASGSGPLYFRAVATVDGEYHWSEEQSVLVESR